MSQLLSRLQNELSAATEPALRAELVARIAAILARHGRFDEARHAVTDIRTHFGAGESGRVTVWTMLAEGLIEHYEAFNPAALDRISRAQFLATAMNYPVVIAVASAWKAHVEFETSRFSGMFQSLELAVRHASETEHDAQTRLSMVLVNVALLCGEIQKATGWFKRGHEHAVRNGDQASIEALLHNRAAFTMAWLRAINCSQAVSSEDLRRVRFEMDSAKNLQDLLGSGALANLVRLHDARLLILESKFESAIDAFGAVRNQRPFATHNFHQSYIDLEISYCQFCLVNFDAAFTTFQKTDLDQIAQLDVDERLVAYWMLSVMSAKDSRFGQVGDYARNLETQQAAFFAQRDLLRAGLISFSS